MGKHSYRLIAAIFVFITIAGTGDSAGQGHPSARVEALGGEAVTGIVRDTLTDMYLHPAFLASCDLLTINYGQRRTPVLYLGFPNLHKEAFYRTPFTERSYYSIIESERSNEITAYGAKIGSWHLAASVEWRLDYKEQSNPEYYSYGDFIPDISQTYRHLANKTDNRYIRIDMTAARELAHGYALGLRIGGSTAENEDSRTTIENSQRYNVYMDPYELIKEFGKYRYDLQEKIRSRSGGFVKAGLLYSLDDAFRSIDLRIARHDIYLRESTHGIYSRTWYDGRGDPDSYERTETKWRDERFGTMWSYDLTGRIWSDAGIRIFAGLGFEHMHYSTKWRDLFCNYDWQPFGYPYSEWDQLGAMDFDGNGDYAGLKAFFNIGKAEKLRDDLEISAGIYAMSETHWTDEKPVAGITFYSFVDGSLITADLDEQLTLSTHWSDTELGIPVSVEFEPAQWISIWASFRVYSQYLKLDDEIPDIDVRNLENITSYIELEDYTAPHEFYKMEDVTVGSTATVGVSLHYKDRFFVDLYTGSDVTPDNLTSYILDVRYVF